MFLFEIVLWLNFRIAVFKDIRQPDDDLFNLGLCKLGADPDNKPGDFSLK